MEFNLTDLGSTLVVGAFLLYGADMISGAFLGRNLLAWLRERTGLVSDHGRIGITLALCFAFGMAAESFSDRAVDRDGYIYKHLAWIPLVLSDEEMKAESLIGRDPNDFHLGQIRASSATKLQLFAFYHSKHDGIKYDRAIRASQAIYYYAKNAVYHEPTYYQELSRLQLRIDFIRSIWAVANILMLYFLAVLTAKLLSDFRAVERGIAALVHWIRPRISTINPPSENPITNTLSMSLLSGRVWLKRTGLDSSSESFAVARKRGALIRRTMMIFALLALCGLVSLLAFRYEENGYNMRIFGYYRMLQREPAPPDSVRLQRDLDRILSPSRYLPTGKARVKRAQPSKETFTPVS